MDAITQTASGLLYERIAFDQRIEESDGMGNTVDTWLEEFQCRAQFMFLRGSETVMAARLESRQPIVVRIRASADAMRVSPEWRMRNVRSGEEYNIRTITYDRSRGLLDLLVESGVAPG